MKTRIYRREYIVDETKRKLWQFLVATNKHSKMINGMIKKKWKNKERNTRPALPFPKISLPSLLRRIDSFLPGVFEL